MKHIVHIFGASGSGTTTLARKLCEELGYFHMDTDDYFWMPTDPKFTEKRPVEERLAYMKQDINTHDNVVISGSLSGWGDPLIPTFTLVVRIEIDAEIRIARLIQREKGRFGARIEPDGDMYEQHRAFVEWAKSYDTGELNMRSKAKHDEWQKLLPCTVLRVDGGDSLEENVAKVKQALEVMT